MGGQYCHMKDKLHDEGQYSVLGSPFSKRVNICYASLVNIPGNYISAMRFNIRDGRWGGGGVRRNCTSRLFRFSNLYFVIDLYFFSQTIYWLGILYK